MNNYKQIQWFPGHMAKALREMNNQINAVDIIIEIVDSRVPFSSRNPEISNMSFNKPRLIIMSKKDLSNDVVTNKWIKYFEDKNNLVLALDTNKLDYHLIKNKCMEVLKDKIIKEKAKGIKNRPIRGLVVGIPNVGKSTFINKMCKRKATKVENRPGVTQTSQYIKIDNEFVLLDTPGVLWPNFEDEKVGLHLALIGSIKQTILPNEQLILELLTLLTHSYKDLISTHYEVIENTVNDEQSCLELLNKIALSRCFIKNNNEPDIDRTIIHILREFANGKLGKISLEEPNNG